VEDIVFEKYQGLTYESMRKLAQDESLARCERVGFPRTYREGKESELWLDIISKLSNLQRTDQLFLDIGCGCSELVDTYLDYLKERQSFVVLSDSPEMLTKIASTNDQVEKIAGRFPENFSEIEKYRGSFDAILSYSVAQMVFEEGNLWSFLDSCLLLLKAQGQLLIGDLPNESKRSRFFSSDTGVKFHQAFKGTNEPPPVFLTATKLGGIDDSIILAILSRMRARGYEAYVLPQSNGLPFCNRREDILVVKP